MRFFLLLALTISPMMFVGCGSAKTAPVPIEPGDEIDDTDMSTFGDGEMPTE